MITMVDLSQAQRHAVEAIREHEWTELEVRRWLRDLRGPTIFEQMVLEGISRGSGA